MDDNFLYQKSSPNNPNPPAENNLKQVQADKQAQPQQQPQLKVKQKLKPLKEAEKIAKYSQELEPVNFIVVNDPFMPSLPFEVGEIFFKEDLVDKNGMVSIYTEKKLKNNIVKENVENKILYVILKNILYGQILQSLKLAFQKSSLKKYGIDKILESYADFLAEHYAGYAAIEFLSSHYPDRLLHTKIINRMPVVSCSRIAVNSLEKQISKDQELINQTTKVFLTLAKNLNEKDKTSITNQIFNTSLNIVPKSCILETQDLFDVELNLEYTGLKINIVYYKN